MKKLNLITKAFYSIFFINYIFYTKNQSLAACDTSTSLFCNPLEGTVDSLKEGGEEMTLAVLGLIGTIALLFFIIAGIMYITAGGEEEKINSAKRMLTGTVIGLGIALISFSLLQVIVDILG